MFVRAYVSDLQIVLEEFADMYESNLSRSCHDGVPEGR